MNLLQFANSRKSKMTEDDIRQIFQRTVAAVLASHSQGIIHRDIKPENLLIKMNEDAKVIDLKLADFGHACKIGCEANKYQKNYGTLGYMAPEIMLPEVDYDERVDAWSLGVLLYNLVTGCMPFKGNYKQVYARTIFKDPKYK